MPEKEPRTQPLGTGTIHVCGKCVHSRQHPHTLTRICMAQREQLCVNLRGTDTCKLYKAKEDK